eukprot:1281640-Pleurochrysis_carterae.AAC.1
MWWLKDEKRVLMQQYTFSLNNKGSFGKSEWGPWVANTDYRNNPVTNEVEQAKVLSSDPKGIDLMHYFPRVEDCPGKEEWLKPEKWSADRVFHDVSRWEY